MEHLQVHQVLRMLVCFKMSFLLECTNTNEIYVIADTHGLRVTYEDQMTPKSTKLHIQYESETT